MSSYGWKRYVSVAERRLKAEKATAKAIKSGNVMAPVAAYRGAVAKTFWGKSWCDNLERYSDYANRLPRGRTYVRNGSVIDLQIGTGTVQAQVMGSSLYRVSLRVAPVAPAQWQALCRDCSGSIASLVELLQGRLSGAVMAQICQPGTGLFPTPQELSFSCSCPDWAGMCKHVAAVLYGVGARLDLQPELLFGLRHADVRDLVTHAGAGLPAPGQAPAPAKVLADVSLADVFGIEMAEPTAPIPALAKPGKPVAAKRAAVKPAVAKPAVAKVTAKVVAQPLAKLAAKASSAKTAAAKKAVAKAPAAALKTARSKVKMPA